MDEVVTVDCSTGEAIRREMNAEELAQRETDNAAYEKQQQAQEEAHAARESVLTKVAKSAGVSVDELKTALGHKVTG